VKVFFEVKGSVQIVVSRGYIPFVVCMISFCLIAVWIQPSLSRRSVILFFFLLLLRLDYLSFKNSNQMETIPSHSLKLQNHPFDTQKILLIFLQHSLAFCASRFRREGILVGWCGARDRDTCAQLVGRHRRVEILLLINLLIGFFSLDLETGE